MKSLKQEREVPPSAGSEGAAVGPYLVASLKRRWKSYQKCLGECQEHFSNESVHALRVGTRRLLALAELLTALLPALRLQKAQRTLKGRFDAFGDLRDAQVQLRFVTRAWRQFPELKPLREHLLKQERRLIKRAAHEVEHYTTAKLNRWVSVARKKVKRAFTGQNASRRRGERIGQVLEGAYAQALQCRSQIDAGDTTTIHRTRIAFKKYRYMVEALHPVMPCVAHIPPGRMRHYQTLMGNIQDAEVLLAYLQKLIAKKKLKAKRLDRFAGWMRRRRTNLIRLYLKSADDLLKFRPLAGAPAAVPPPVRPARRGLPRRVAP